MAHDISRIGLVIGGRSADPSRSGDFFKLAELPKVAASGSFGGRDSISVMKARTREGSVTTGRYETSQRGGWHGLMGDLLREQTAQVAAGAAFEGFEASYVNPTSGDRVTGLVWVMADPEVNEAETETAIVWKILWLDTVSDYGSGPG
jgi:hypothetical protein